MELIPEKLFQTFSHHPFLVLGVPGAALGLLRVVAFCSLYRVPARPGVRPGELIVWGHRWGPQALGGISWGDFGV